MRKTSLVVLNILIISLVLVGVVSAEPTFAKDGDGGNYNIFSVPASCKETTSCPANQICNPLGYKSVECLVSAITAFLMTVSVPIAVVMFVIAGIYFVTSAGDPGRIKTAKMIMLYTAIGFGVILVASGLIRVIQSLLQGKS